MKRKNVANELDEATRAAAAIAEGEAAPVRYLVILKFPLQCIRLIR